MSGFRFTWGTGILIFIILFLLANAWLLIFSSGVKWNMVEDNYYQKELEYGSKMEKMKNALVPGQNVSVNREKEACQVVFPRQADGTFSTGTIHLYRPSDEDLDHHLKAIPDSGGRVTIPYANLKKGKYVLKMDWTFEGRPCYREEDLILF